MKYKIMCLGNQWRGSDDGSLFRAFSRLGHLIHIVDHKMYSGSERMSIASKITFRVFNPLFLRDFNNEIERSVNQFKPDVVCVYKGNCIFPETLERIKRKGIPIICVYPDVSFYDHGSSIPKLVPYYDYIFSTKSFGKKDLKEKFNFTNVSVIKHAVDPDIHRIIQIGPNDFNYFSNDVSFIGSHSLKKENIMQEVISYHRDLIIKIWGGGWRNSDSKQVKSKYTNSGIFGDLYVAAIIKSKINLGILSEKGKGSSSGDLITARTFHIPGAGGFMIHERTDELLEIFEEGESVECYGSSEELNEKIEFYLKNEESRIRISKKGHEQVWKYHKSDDRAQEIIDILISNDILNK